MKKKQGNLIWITGLSGSGKTTLAKELHNYMVKKHLNTLHMDGDELREILNENTSYDITGRKKMAKIYSNLCSYLTNQGINVIMSTISLFHEIHNLNSRKNDNYYEILLRTNKNILVKRKNHIYNHSENIMGISQKPEFPKNPSLILQNNNPNQIKKNIEKIIKLININ